MNELLKPLIETAKDFMPIIGVLAVFVVISLLYKLIDKIENL